MQRGVCGGTLQNMTGHLRLISKGEFSRRVSCSKTLIYKLTKPGGRLAHTLVDGKLDLDDPDLVAFGAQYDYQEPDTALIAAAARKQGIEIAKANRRAEAPNRSAKAKPKTAAAPAPKLELIEDEEGRNADSYLNMTVYEVVTRYGTQAEFAKLASAAKNLIQMRGYEEEQARKRGEYIHRSHAERLVAMIDGMQKAILTDAVSNIANTTAVMARTGEEKPEVERAIRDVLSRIIKTTKDQVVRGLRDL